jgi:hypothetical protein
MSIPNISKPQQSIWRFAVMRFVWLMVISANVSQNPREMWEISANHEQHSHWQPENPLHKRTFARRFCKFERQRGSRISSFPRISSHEKAGEIGSRNALDLPVRLLFLPLWSSKKRIWDEPSCREFTHVERREPLQRRFLKQPMVVLLNIRAEFPRFALKSAQHSRYLPGVYQPPVHANTEGDIGFRRSSDG